MDEQQVEVHDKRFKLFITRDEIRARVREMAWEITKKYKDVNPVFVPILNGSFIFAADLLRACQFDAELAFVKIKSYQGMESTGRLDMQLDVDIPLRGRPVIIIEDIVDSGNTLRHFLQDIQRREPSFVAIATFLLKPDAIKYDLPLDYVGYRIPNAFVVGYGLDYDGLGRTLPGIYQLDEG